MPYGSIAGNVTARAVRVFSGVGRAINDWLGGWEGVERRRLIRYRGMGLNHMDKYEYVYHVLLDYIPVQPNHNRMAQ